MWSPTKVHAVIWHVYARGTSVSVIHERLQAMKSGLAQWFTIGVAYSEKKDTLWKMKVEAGPNFQNNAEVVQTVQQFLALHALGLPAVD
ncbi:hypothetical protein TNCV_2778461 [Trichonephila clavipes]|nr:hypothetical protein TNCV_2778461 [Trichonephila clavipes]